MTARRWSVLDIAATEAEIAAAGLEGEDEWPGACAALMAGCLGLEEKPVRDGLRALVACFSTDEDAEVAARELLASLVPALVEGPRTVEDPGWVEAFNASLRPVDIGGRFVVVPGGLDAPASDRLVLRLDPGRAFGTGHHESTRLAIEFLENTVSPGCRVLDVGTGSGILAMAAARLGASRVLASDIDAEAIEVAGENVAGIPERDVIELVVSEEVPSGSGVFDVVVANIQRDVLIGLLDELLARRSPGGALVLSGLLGADRETMHEALAARGECAEERVAGEWMALCSRARR